ncbi:MAG: flagellar hook-length control protein FliK, partial [Planktotalea sp.]|uniref:flagellar hook-length control protein FliK n=1 Tax=Planktotalea sp. TaxID=2029877 RepID=UPI003C74A296
IAQIDHLSQSTAINVVLPQTTISTEGVKPLLSTGIEPSNRIASDEILEMNRAVANEERPIANAPLQSGPHANLGAISLASMKPETQGTRASPEISERGSKYFGEHSEHKTTKNSTKLFDVKSEMHTALSDFRSVSSLQTGQPTSGAREETLMLDAPSELQNQMPIKGESLAHTTPHLSTGATHRTLPAGNIQAVSDAILTLRDSGGKIDVALAPEELGRLSIKLDNTAQGALFTLSAERGETQELIRRQLEQLQEQFRAMGFENAQFAFDGQGQAFGDPHNQEFEDSAALTTANKSPASVETRKFIAAGGLDIRI